MAVRVGERRFEDRANRIVIGWPVAQGREGLNPQGRVFPLRKLDERVDLASFGGTIRTGVHVHRLTALESFAASKF